MLARNPLNDTLRQDPRPQRPLLLSLFAGGLIAQAVGLPIAFVLVLFSSSESTVVYNGVETTMGAVRLKMLAILAVWSAVAAYLGPALWRGKASARTVVLVVLLAGCIASLVSGSMNVPYRGIIGLLLAAGYVLVST